MTTKKFKNTFIEFHILQSFPVSCLNRDDVGSPKTAIVGGVNRARVSSQAWKRQVRLTMQDFGIKLAIRSKNLESLITQECLKFGGEEKKITECSKKIANVLGKDTLLFFTNSEAFEFAKYIQEKQFNSEGIIDKDISKIAKKVLNLHLDGLDIALFGRMIAQSPDLDIQGAASFSHAISTHKSSSEIDFFTAVDDILNNEHMGAAHMGSLEYNSATYYRYISLDLAQLNKSLNELHLEEAISAFVRALYIAVPSARQNSMSAAGSWDYANVLVRNGQRLQLSFDKPVRSNGDGYVEPSIQSLKNDLKIKENMSGTLFNKLLQIELPTNNIDDLVKKLQEFVRGYNG